MGPSGMWSWSRKVACDAWLMFVVFARRNKLVRLSISLEEKPTAQQHPQCPHQPHRFLHHGPDEIGGRFQLSKCQSCCRMLLWGDQLHLQVHSLARWSACGVHFTSISKCIKKTLFKPYCSANPARPAPTAASLPRWWVSACSAPPPWVFE
jgi:hypothetical protein